MFEEIIELEEAGDDVSQDLKRNGFKNINELIDTYEKRTKRLNATIGEISSDGKFDEEKFRKKFYREATYSGITIGINKFPPPKEWAGLGKSANTKTCFDEIKLNRMTQYDIQAETKGKNFGYIKNLEYKTKADPSSKTYKKSVDEEKQKNKIINEVTKIKDNYYGLIFNIACKDALITFNYTDYLRNKVGKYEDITNLFRGNFSFYSIGGKNVIKYDSVVVPIDCFKPVKLNNVYPIETPKTTKTVKTTKAIKKTK